MEHFRKFYRALCRGIGTPLASEALAALENEEWDRIVYLSVSDPFSYENSEAYWADTVIVDLLRKCKLPTSFSTRTKAVETFWACEAQNKKTNDRLTRYLHNGPFEDPSELAVLHFISEVRKEVCQLMGRLPRDLTPRFSSGATYADNGVFTTIPDKMSNRPQITHAARCLLPLWEDTGWARAYREPMRQWACDPLTVRGNKFFTVPKDGKTDRGCCKEPSINVAYQLDIDRLLKNRLRDKWAIDLARGQDLHRDLAALGSITGHLATIDMSNASDTLARVLVQLLVPDEWYALLTSLRSPLTEIDGSWVYLEKFSSMGNGFTFTLETTIFAGIARALVRLREGDPDHVRVYGDDVIIGAEYAKDYLAALALFGFTPNRKKTYEVGPFRESCGGDFWGGVPVRGHFLKKLPDEPQEWISLANGLRRTAAGIPSRWLAVKRAWHACLDAIPVEIRSLRGPETLGDIVIHDDPKVWERSLLPHPRERTWEPRWLRAYAPIPAVIPWKYWTPAVQLSCTTLGLDSRGVTPRGGVSGYRIVRVAAYGVAE